jgi:hypothetical protein
MPKAETKTKVVKLPTSPGACADLLYNTRQDRLTLQKQVEKLQALETQIKEHFITTLSKAKSKETGVIGKIACVEIDTKPVPVVEDWDKFYAHIAKTKNFELMQRRVNDTAVKERWEAKKEVPGVGRFNAVTVSCTKK